jgi:hypothetical protein
MFIWLTQQRVPPGWPTRLALLAHPKAAPTRILEKAKHQVSGPAASEGDVRRALPAGQ